MPGGPGLDLDPGGQHVGRLGQHKVTFAAREQAREDVLEGDAHVVPRLGEHLLHPLVDLADDVEQVAAGALEVLELLAEELVALLQRGELLERERVDLAQHRERPLGRAQPLLLLRPDEGHCFGTSLGRGVVLLALDGRRRRDQLIGTVVGDERLDVHPELLESPLSELLQAHALLGAGHFVAVNAVDQLIVGLGELADLGPHGHELLFTRAPARLHRLTLPLGLRRWSPPAARERPGRRP